MIVPRGEAGLGDEERRKAVLLGAGPRWRLLLPWLLSLGLCHVGWLAAVVDGGGCLVIPIRVVVVRTPTLVVLFRCAPVVFGHLVLVPVPVIFPDSPFLAPVFVVLKREKRNFKLNR